MNDTNTKIIKRNRYIILKNTYLDYHTYSKYNFTLYDLIKKEFPEVRKKLWKEAFWSQSYCLLTVGGAPMSILKQYIENQAGVPHT